MQSASLVRRPSLAPVLDCFQLAIKHWSQGSPGNEAIAKCMQVKRVMKPCVSTNCATDWITLQVQTLQTTGLR